MVGCFATSKAGHDKTTVYVILREDDEYVYLADGRLKTVDKPKKKKRMHIQPTRIQVESDLMQKIMELTARNEEIERAIAVYSQRFQ